VIKLKDLLLERIVTDNDFHKVINMAKKATGAKPKIPSRTIKLCSEVKKDGFHKLDYQGKKSGRAREPHKLMYQYYAYVQGWGHSKYKNDWDWRSDKADKILNWVQTSGYNSNIFEYDYLKYHVNTDMQASQVVGNIRPGSKDEEPAYYLVKDYLNSFGAKRGGRDEDMLVAKVDWWLKKNKVETR